MSELPDPAVRAFIARAIAQTEAQDAAEAEAWTVLALDPEQGGMLLFGVFADPVDAMRKANELDETDRRTQEQYGDTPWLHLVMPIHRSR